MRVAVLDDVHGNAPALEAVLREAEGERVDLLVFGGDVAAGPLPRQTLAILGTLPGPRFVRGNADRYMVDAFDGREGPALEDPWFAEQITQADRDLLAGFELSLSVDVDGLGPTLFCHGSPRSDEEMITSLSPWSRLEIMLAGVSERVVVCGHTHTQFDRTFDDARIVNPGSVGMPYEDCPGAYWAILGPDVELRSTSYDLDAAAARIRLGGWPGAQDFIANNLVRCPATAAEAAEYFERLAVERDR